MRIGIDVGGTKIEAIALDDGGVERARHRVATPRDYTATLDALAGLVERVEAEAGAQGTIGVGMPGAISPRTGRVKNANTTWLNGRLFHRDLAARLGRPVRCVNDANCLAVSEATDGAAAGLGVVFAVILGTGCGGGLAVDGAARVGRNAVAGEWGHAPLPWPRGDELPGPACFCGRTGCLEMWLSGTGLAADYRRATGTARDARAVVAAAEAGEPAATAALDRLIDRLARALAIVVDLIDPDAIVVGGGLSNLDRIYTDVPARLAAHVFGGEAGTPILRAMHGDSSGVRGAAWLWPGPGEPDDRAPATGEAHP